MIRTGTGLLALILAVLALDGPAQANSMLAEQAAALVALLDEVAVLALILAACILIDKTSWPVLTGQKSDRTDPVASGERSAADRAKGPGN